MVLRASTLFVCLLLAWAAAAETVYKYRSADGQITYSNRRIPGAVPIDTFEEKFAPPAPAAVGSARRATPADEARISKRLATLDAAWNEVLAATTALNAAQARLAAGVAPFEEEAVSLAGPGLVVPLPDMTGKTDAEKAGIVGAATEKAQNESQAIGGPQRAASPAVGGPLPRASAAAGGPTARLGGGGRNVEYHERMALLEADVQKARTRVDVAYRRYNELR